MKNRPFYQKIYTDMICDKYPEKKNVLDQYLNKKRWTSLDVIEINDVLFGNSQDDEKKSVSQKHRSYDFISIRKILDYQQRNKLNNNELSLKYKISRNTIAKWKKLFEEEL